MEYEIIIKYEVYGVHDNISVPLIYMDSSDWRRGRTPPAETIVLF